jgi:hypothetical protein
MRSALFWDITQRRVVKDYHSMLLFSCLMCGNFVPLIDFVFLLYYGIDYVFLSLSALSWFKQNRTLNETALSKGTFSIRINVHRSKLYSHLMFQ